MVERLRKPPYAYQHALEKFQETGEFDEGSTGEAIVKLGTMEELYVRSAAAYAARVLNVVGKEITKNVSMQDLGEPCISLTSFVISFA